MKRVTIIATILTSVLALVFVFMAAERALACADTAQALDTINAGLDWDGVTKISQEQATDRLNANLDVFVSQKSERNTWGGLALLMVLAATGSGFMMKKNLGVTINDSVVID